MSAVDDAFAFDYEFWQVEENTEYLRYLEYQRTFLNSTGHNQTTTGPVVDPEWLTPLKWVICLVLICLSATFSGLTLGLMGLDPYGLELIIRADPEAKEALQAKKILRFRRDGNLMLCTLLLGNVAVNALLPIYLDELLGELVAFFISTFALVILGEIVPQSVCSRYALAIGSRLIWLLVFFTVVLYIIAKPIALVLDAALGEEMGTIHNKNELVEIVRFHQEQGVMQGEEAKTVRGALLYSDVKVESVMTKSELVFFLREDDPLNFDKISAIFRSGHSRVPVCAKDDPHVIVGILLTKDLILIDPDDNMLVSEILEFFKRPVVKVTTEDTLGDVMALFKTGRAHLAIVTNTTSDIVRRRKNTLSSLDDSSSSSSESDSDNDHGAAAGEIKEGGKKKKIKKEMSIAEKTVIALKKKKRKKREKQRKKQKQKMLAESKQGAHAISPMSSEQFSPASSPGRGSSGSSPGLSSPGLSSPGLSSPGLSSPSTSPGLDSPVASPGASSPLPHSLSQSATPGFSGEDIVALDIPERVLGIVTLEDIIEEILGDEIVDETDLFVEVEKHDTSIKRGKSMRVAERITLLDSVEKDTLEAYEETLISQTLAELLADALCGHDHAFAGLDVELAIALRPAVTEVVHRSNLATLMQGHIVAERNEEIECAYLVIDGLIETTTGTGSFKAVAGRFQAVGAGVLVDCLLAQRELLKSLSSTSAVGDALDSQPQLSRRNRTRSRADGTEYVADFHAQVSSKKCRVLEIDRKVFAEVLKTTMVAPAKQAETGQGPA